MVARGRPRRDGGDAPGRVHRGTLVTMEDAVTLEERADKCYEAKHLDHLFPATYVMCLDCARAAVEAEREACAKIVENASLDTVDQEKGRMFVSFSQIAAAIRARQEPR